MTALLLLMTTLARGQATIPREPVREAVADIKALPPDAQKELKKLYARYVEHVHRRAEEGWFSGLLSDDLVDGSDKGSLPARQIEAALKKREKAKAPKSELRKWRRANSRSKGLCIDWSDAVWAELIKLKPEYWDVQDRRRKTRPFHTGAVACAGEDIPVCLALDPWETGKPEIYVFQTWDDGDFTDKLPADFFLHSLPDAD